MHPNNLPLALGPWPLALGSWLLVLSLSLSSCSKLVNDQFPEYDPIPNVNSILVAGDSVSVHISLAEKIDKTYMTLIDNAEIVLSDEQGLEVNLKSEGEGIYTSDTIIHPGGVYTYNIHVDGYPEMKARDTVPLLPFVKIEGTTRQAKLDDYGTLMSGIDISFTDDPGTMDYYELILFKRDEDRFWNLYTFNENSTILLNEGLEPYTTETLIFSDELIDETTVNLRLDFYGGGGKRCYGSDSCYAYYDPATYIIELRHVSVEYYKFKKHFYLYEKLRYPFFIEGTASAFATYSNIENGLGVFASYAKSIDSIQLGTELIPLFE
ncbi:MAG: DUF4249 domain-containing protein [Bacteroidales bacterium]|nr:DUF4249 domain-containing protein [Bacteroidales bacterium]